MRILLGLFLIGHGLVHALYVGHARRRYEIQPGAGWPDGSWALSRWLGDPVTRWLVAVVFSLVAAAFAVAGIAVLLGAPWWAPVAASAALASVVVTCAGSQGGPIAENGAPGVATGPWSGVKAP